MFVTKRFEVNVVHYPHVVTMRNQSTLLANKCQQIRVFSTRNHLATYIVYTISRLTMKIYKTETNSTFRNLSMKILNSGLENFFKIFKLPVYQILKT